VEDYLPPKQDDKAKLTAAGCVVTLLSAVVIFGLAVPVVHWHDPATGHRLPLEAAVWIPILAGACFHGAASFVLWLLGIPVWSRQPADDTPATQGDKTQPDRSPSNGITQNQSFWEKGNSDGRT
jgi:hypothetical protein